MGNYEREDLIGDISEALRRASEEQILEIHKTLIRPGKSRPASDKPEPGKIYRLTSFASLGTTAFSGAPSIARGDPLADCEVVE